MAFTAFRNPEHRKRAARDRRSLPAYGTRSAGRSPRTDDGTHRRTARPCGLSGVAKCGENHLTPTWIPCTASRGGRAMSKPLLALVVAAALGLTVFLVLGLLGDREGAGEIGDPADAPAVREGEDEGAHLQGTGTPGELRGGAVGRPVDHGPRARRGRRAAGGLPGGRASAAAAGARSARSLDLDALQERRLGPRGRGETTTSSTPTRTSRSRRRTRSRPARTATSRSRGSPRDPTTSAPWSRRRA